MANEKTDSQKDKAQGNSSRNSNSTRKNRGKKSSRRRRFRRRKRSSDAQKDPQKRTTDDSTQTQSTASSQPKKSADGKSARASRRQRNARARRRRRERRRAEEAAPSYSIIDDIEQEYTPPQSVFVYTHTIRPNQGGGYEFRSDSLPAPSRHIEDFRIDLSGIVGTLLDSEAENAGVQVEWNWGIEADEEDVGKEATAAEANGTTAQS